MPSPQHTHDHINDYNNVFVDGLSADVLDSALVRAAREEETQVSRDHNGFDFVPIANCRAMMCKDPIGTRWVDVKPNDEAQPEYLSCCVAQEANRGHDDNIFAGTPPLEAKKALFSMAMASPADNRTSKPRGAKKLLFIGVRRAYFYSPAILPMVASPPPEAQCPDGYCAKLNVAMYGTRAAACIWEQTFTAHPLSHGFLQGSSTPCAFEHPDRDVRLVVHGDDSQFLRAS